ncbi:30S ribosomal protein S21 [Aegicerativicinus sediminis]|uniref:30S ribosomal protein S21 n=1 Tax=Aegicerativicinus sediminis TaxID=2893202 RepID=UPI001E4F1023|nr:30S ribosomal protein S21 [Aegicerativicinus sediminis]
MIIISVNPGEPIERALKRYKRKVRNVKQLQNIRETQYFTKKSIQKRNQLNKAIYKQGLKVKEDI